ncbi:BMC domain-containing protein [Clostridium perfringens]|uniref:BMC domain-containing protein n=1 Tax=Clostridium perfringens TaxID=1502 RepID=UPI000166B676|nr:BMC domain-containing protein [Clostridium perfringens]AXH51995.1 BMC domain-containing protein [Clostridium perfringens]EDS79096.1 ethanolamine utilization protein [Clostridium perfringens C str. JGS1495]ELC8421851.1 BMC domain-containing protein [Clostridium perfringens]MBI6029876.1 BMC domain-containing protein [Clostridium perfringens]MBI6032498.1 BMC domain-containing protein [Clostridium perfringens]
MGKALGLIEFIGYVPAICAADTALKSASVDLIGIEKVTGGIVTVKITGDVDAVQAAVESAENYASRIGSLRSAHVIPRLDDEVENFLMNSKSSEEEIEEKIQELEEDIKEVCEEIREEITETIIEETESKEESLQEDVVEYVKNVNDEVEEISEKIEGDSYLDKIEVFEISQNKESSKESLEEVIIKPELIEDKEEYSEDKTTENKEADSIDIKEISKMSVKELRKKIKSLNINITSNKLKSLKKKDLVDILLKYNEEGDS